MFSFQRLQLRGSGGFAPRFPNIRCNDSTFVRVCHVNRRRHGTAGKVRRGTRNELIEQICVSAHSQAPASVSTDWAQEEFLALEGAVRLQHDRVKRLSVDGGGVRSVVIDSSSNVAGTSQMPYFFSATSFILRYTALVQPKPITLTL